MTISFFKSKAKCISNRAQELRHRIDQLDTIICDNFTELKSIYQEKGKQTMFRAKCRWIENGEHPIKFFSILKKLITTKKTISELGLQKHRKHRIRHFSGVVAHKFDYVCERSWRQIISIPIKF